MQHAVFIAATSRVVAGRIASLCEREGTAVHRLQEEARILEELRAVGPDLIFLQANLVEDAAEPLVGRIRQDEVLEGAYVVLFSSRSQWSGMALEVGADVFLPMPFREGDLAAVFRHAYNLPRRLLLVGQAAEGEVAPALARRGHEVVVAADGAAAWAQLEEAPPDLVICDEALPDMAGLEFLRTLRGTDALCHLPLVLLLATEAVEFVETCFDAGAQDLLFAPFAAESNLERLDAIVKLPKTGRKLKALVVDDSPAVRTIMAKMFRQLGFAVTTRENGKLGLESARRERPDVITSDYEMPVMDGWAFCKALKQSPDLADIPVIMVTTLAAEGDRKKGQVLGVDGYLAKPFQVPALETLVVEVMDRARRRKEARLLSRYVSTDTVRSVEEVIDGDKAQDQVAAEKTVAMLFADICRFTTISEVLSARETVVLLNRYFDCMIECLDRNQAIVDKLIGDAIVARFDSGDPVEDSLWACRAALDMLAALPGLNEASAMPIHIRIGINVGPVILGNLGSSRFRLDYTMIGDPVNTAQRLESHAPMDGCLISGEVWELIEDRIEVGQKHMLMVKNRTEPVRACILVGMR